MVSRSNVFTSVFNKHSDKPQQLAKYCALLAHEKKAEGVRVLSVADLTSYADYFVICSATGERHAQALARQVIDSVKKDAHLAPIGIEGIAEGDWILVDFGDFVFHVFTEEGRSYYDLDGLWADAKTVPYLENSKPKTPSLRPLVTCES